MKVSIHDPTTLRGLRPLEVVAYLRAQGWRRETEFGDKGSLWLRRSEDGTESDVTLPLRRELADYALRMSELLQTLAEVEQRSELEVVRDIETTATDLIRVRARSDEAYQDSLPIEQAVSFVERSRDLMLAAACAVIDKRAFFAKRKRTQAMEYLQRIRMGQTERGSYVLTILSPVPPELRPAQQEFGIEMEPADPYERQVTRVLLDSLSALGSAAQEAALRGAMGPFDAAVQRGVSANLCDAVLGLSRISPGQDLDVQVAWSRSRPVAVAVPARVVLGSDTFPIIEEAGRHFRATTPLDDFDIQGVVTRLARDADARDGEVTITGSIDGQMRKIVVKLDEETYRVAVGAHNERLTVQCAGDLIRTAHGFQLQNARHFSILDDDRPGLDQRPEE